MEPSPIPAREAMTSACGWLSGGSSAGERRRPQFHTLSKTADPLLSVVLVKCFLHEGPPPPIVIVVALFDVCVTFDVAVTMLVHQ